MHDNFDASFDVSPTKKRLPLNTNRCHFNVEPVNPGYDNVLLNRHMYFSPKPKYAPMAPK
jgi:hypothetical protein